MKLLTIIGAIGLSVTLCTTAFGQVSRQPLRRSQPQGVFTVPPKSERLPPVYEMRPIPIGSIRDHSWTHIDPQLPQTIKQHDIIKIIVDEKSETTLRSGFDRQQTTNFLAELREFVRIGQSGNLANAANNQPTIDANVTGRMRNQGRVTDQEGMRYRIAASVIKVLPNGNLLLYARKSIRSDRDVWSFTVTGVVASKSVSRAGTVLSEDIADLNIVKKRQGKVYSSTKWRWGTRLYDMFWPF